MDVGIKIFEYESTHHHVHTDRWSELSMRDQAIRKISIYNPPLRTTLQGTPVYTAPLHGIPPRHRPTVYVYAYVYVIAIFVKITIAARNVVT